jgi:hypothetical protein
MARAATTGGATVGNVTPANELLTKKREGWARREVSVNESFRVGVGPVTGHRERAITPPAGTPVDGTWSGQKKPAMELW